MSGAYVRTTWSKFQGPTGFHAKLLNARKTSTLHDIQDWYAGTYSGGELSHHFLRPASQIPVKYLNPLL